MMPSRREVADLAVVARLGALALQHHHLDGGLVVCRGGEGLLLLRGDGGVARDHDGGHAAERLHTQRQRGDVEQHHVLHVAAEHACLDRRADGHDLIRVDAPVRVLAEELP